MKPERNPLDQGPEGAGKEALRVGPRHRAAALAIIRASDHLEQGEVRLSEIWRSIVRMLTEEDGGARPH